MKKYKQNLMTKHWVEFWNNSRIEYSKKMEFFQFEAFLELKKYISSVLSEQKTCSILNAGSGIDKVAYYLNKHFKNKIEITLLDISENCLLQNKKIFKYGSDIKLEVGDIFESPKFRERYDIIYNTGLLEHFDDINKSIILENVSIMLKKGGYFITFNPSAKGKLYFKMKCLAEKKNKWEFGEEIPIETLKQFNKKFGMALIIEKDMASMQQIYFLKYINKPFKLFGRLLSYLEYFPKLYFRISYFFGKRIGYYIIASIFKKNI